MTMCSIELYTHQRALRKDNAEPKFILFTYFTLPN